LVLAGTTMVLPGVLGGAVTPAAGASSVPAGRGVSVVPGHAASAVAGQQRLPRLSAAGQVAGAPGWVVGEAPLTNGGGFFVAFSSGTVDAVGTAHWQGDMAGKPLNAPIVGIAATPSGDGYWLVAADGGIFAFGDALFYGSMGAHPLNEPIVGMAATVTGRGYWLVASDGGIFSFGDAGFYGSTGSMRLNDPIVGIADTPSGDGYWLAATDGGIFSFGDARFYGSTGSMRLNQPVIGIASSSDGGGYWLAASDGGVFTFGDASFQGSAVGAMGGGRAVGIIRAPSDGYWMLTSLGAVLPYGAPEMPAFDVGPSPTGSSSPTPGTPSPLPASVEPTASVQPSAAFMANCFSTVTLDQCNTAALQDIDQARAGEGLGPLVLPADYYQLSQQAQVLAVANAERTSRGLAAMPENPTLDDLAQQGVQDNSDPQGPAGYSWGSNMAWGYVTALAADFGWMYDDGPGGDNVGCTATVTSGCWAHRENILAPWSGEAGAGYLDSGGQVSYSELFVENY
jgi:uncharacterized protein YkwD